MSIKIQISSNEYINEIEIQILSNGYINEIVPVVINNKKEILKNKLNENENSTSDIFNSPEMLAALEAFEYVSNCDPSLFD